jgi:hypothetical protein
VGMKEVSLDALDRRQLYLTGFEKECGFKLPKCGRAIK